MKPWHSELDIFSKSSGELNDGDFVYTTFDDSLHVAACVVDIVQGYKQFSRCQGACVATVLACRDKRYYWYKRWLWLIVCLPPPSLPLPPLSAPSVSVSLLPLSPTFSPLSMLLSSFPPVPSLSLALWCYFFKSRTLISVQIQYLNTCS